MKLKFPKKRANTETRISDQWLVLVILITAFFAFVAGSLFYRSGYVSKISSAIRWLPHRPAVVQVLDEVKDEIAKETKLYQSNGLANLFLDIPFDSMLAIEEKRKEALEVGVLFSSDDDLVPATARYNDEQTLDIRLRLKGDWVDHLETEKWSFRIHITENDGAILGMRRVSLQAPETRSFISEWGYHQNLFLEGILATRYHFVNVIVNGEHKGIYALEESFHEDLLESQGRREGIIVRFDENLLWDNMARFLETYNSVGLFWLVDDPLSSQITPFRGTRIANDEVLSEELVAAQELLYSLYHGDLSADQVLAEEIWGKYFAITDLWGGGHGSDWHNDRFYYNPVTGLIEPIAFDAYVFHGSYDKDKLAFPFSSTPLFDNLGVQQAYIETLERIITPEYREMLQNEFGKPISEVYELLVEEYKDRQLLLEKHEGPPLQLPWDNLAYRADLLKRNISPGQPVQGNYRLVKQGGVDFLKIDLVNLMVVPVVIDSIGSIDGELPFDPAWCSGGGCQYKMAASTENAILLSGNKTNFEPVTFFVPLDQLKMDETGQSALTIWATLYGSSNRFEIPIYSNYVPQGIETGVKPSTNLEDALAAHEFLVQISETQLAILPGDWRVDSNLILPEGFTLLIPANTTLRFAENGVFLAQGSLEMMGTEDFPILLTAQGESWGGLVVLDALGKSTWQYVKVEKMAGIQYPGWILTGGITFYESDISISDATIGNNTTEDALNIIRSDFSLERVEFLNTASDAFDGDFVTGSVAQSSFHDVTGDAIDVSGSQVAVRDSYFVDIGDKAISAGEKSEVQLNHLVIRNVGIGIASKDLSTVTAEHALIENARVAGLAAYIKKPQYGPASIEARFVEIVNVVTPAICQTDSYISLNRQIIQPEDIDVDNLYEQGVLGN